MFRNRGDVDVKFALVPPSVKERESLLRRTFYALVECRNKGGALTLVGENPIEHVVSVKALSIVRHTSRVSHPETFAVNDFERGFSRSVMNESQLPVGAPSL